MSAAPGEIPALGAEAEPAPGLAGWVPAARRRQNRRGGLKGAGSCGEHLPLGAVGGSLGGSPGCLGWGFLPIGGDPSGWELGLCPSLSAGLGCSRLPRFPADAAGVLLFGPEEQATLTSDAESWNSAPAFKPNNFPS